MNGLSVVLRHFVRAEMARGRAVLDRVVVKTVGYVVAAVIAMIGVQGLAVASYFALAEEMAPPLAALVTAGEAFLIAGAIILGVSFSTRRERRRSAAAPAPRPEAGLRAERTKGARQSGTKEPVPPAALGVEAALGALIVGVALGSSPALRSALGRLLAGTVKPPRED